MTIAARSIAIRRAALPSADALEAAERVNDFETPRGRNLVLRRVDGRDDRGIGPGAVSAANGVDPQVVLSLLTLVEGVTPGS